MEQTCGTTIVIVMMDALFSIWRSQTKLMLYNALVAREILRAVTSRNSPFQSSMRQKPIELDSSKAWAQKRRKFATRSLVSNILFGRLIHPIVAPRVEGICSR